MNYINVIAITDDDNVLLDVINGDNDVGRWFYGWLEKNPEMKENIDFDEGGSHEIHSDKMIVKGNCGTVTFRFHHYEILDSSPSKSDIC